MNTKNLINELWRRFPKKVAAKYDDFVGFMGGIIPDDSKKIILALDFDREIFDIAKEYKPDLIITHHPFIYGKKNDVFKDNPKIKDLYYEVVKSKYAIYSFHTNFDECENGMNDALSGKLGLNNVYSPKDAPMMRIGELKEAMDLASFASYAKNALEVDYALLLNYGKDKVKKVGIVGGAGSGYFKVAKKEGCDIFISGDVPHHVRRDIITDKYNYLDIPHEVEKIFLPTMRKILLEIDPTLDIIEIDHESFAQVI